MSERSSFFVGAKKTLLQMLMEAPLVLKRDRIQGLASFHLAVANFIKVQPDHIANAQGMLCLLIQFSLSPIAQEI
jgi:hypothetical protein